MRLRHIPTPVIVPVYNLPEDDQAIAIYQAQLPGKTITPIDATDIIRSGGAWHCVAMEVPSPNNP